MGGELKADVVVAGGGLGGFAAALAALRNGLRVIMTEETEWIGGQITQQGVPSDEHQWIETTGATQMYRDYRNAVRDYYRKYYPMTEKAKNNPLLNPGNSTGARRLGHEPRVSLAVMNEMLAPYRSSRQLVLLLKYKVVEADSEREKVKSITAQHLPSGEKVVLQAPYFVDATELGDLLPMTGTDYVTGTESQAQTGELHAPETADPKNEDNYIDFSSFPLQIPLGALIPIQKDNLIPACKNIGTTHITNGCYRLAPVEWSIGEAVGLLVAFTIKNKKLPRQVRENRKLLSTFQDFIRLQGIDTHWPDKA